MLENVDLHIYDRELLVGGIADYWKGQTVEERINAMMSFDEKKGSELGIGMYLLNLYRYGGVGHFVVDYPRLMTLGYDGIKAKLDTVDVKLRGGGLRSATSIRL